MDSSSPGHLDSLHQLHGHMAGSEFLYYHQDRFFAGEEHEGDVAGKYHQKDTSDENRFEAVFSLKVIKQVRQGLSSIDTDHNEGKGNVD
jgi:hypothetical protein